MPSNPTDLTADELVTIGRDSGKSPAQIADGLRRWQSDVSAWAAENKPVEKWIAGREAMAKDIQSYIDQLAGEQMASEMERMIPSKNERYIFGLKIAERTAEGDGNQTSWTEEDDRMVAKLNQSMSGNWRANDVGQARAININGAQVGTANVEVGAPGKPAVAWISGGKRDANGELTPSHKLVKLTTPTKEELEAEAMKAEDEADRLEEQSMNIAMNPEDNSGSTAAMDAMAVEARKKAEVYRSSQGAEALLHERLIQQIKESNVADEQLGLDRGAVATGKAVIQSVVMGSAKGIVTMAKGAGDIASLAIGDNSLSQWGTEKIKALDETSPVNPLQRGGAAAQVGEAVGQVVPIVATSGGAAAATKAAGLTEVVAARVATGAATATMASMGASGGADTATEYGMTWDDAPMKRRLMIAAGMIIEPASEKMGGVIEASMGAKLAGVATDAAKTGAFKQGIIEGGEEIISGAATDVAVNIIGPEGDRPAPNPMNPVDRLKEFALGMIPGTVMAVASNAGTSTAEEVQPAPAATPTSQPATTQQSPAVETPAPVQPMQPATMEWNGSNFYRDHVGGWSQINAPDSSGNIYAPLDPDHPADGAAIVALEAEYQSRKRKAQAAPAKVEEQVTVQNKGTENTSIQDQSSTEAPPIKPSATVENATVEGRPQPEANPMPQRTARTATDLQPPDGTDDLISVMQGEDLRLGEPNDKAEWEWYRQLQREAANVPPLDSHQERNRLAINARVKRGELNHQAVMLEWINQNVLGGESQINQVAAQLENDPAQRFKVDNVNFGDSIMAAIDARIKARTQVDNPDVAAEAEAIQAEDSARKEFWKADAMSKGRKMNGVAVANEAGEGSTIQVGGITWTVESANAETGDVAISNPDVGSFRLTGNESFTVESIDGTTQQNIEGDVDAPFSYAGENAPETDPVIARVGKAIQAHLGNSISRDRIEVINDPNATDPATGRRWKATIQNGKITINAALIDDDADAIWNVEHELGHEVYRSNNAELRDAWNSLQAALSSNPDIMAEVENLGYQKGQQLEESLVRLAQKLDGTALTAWQTFLAVVKKLITGQWSKVSQVFSDRVAAIAASKIMAEARGRADERPGSTDAPRYSYGMERRYVAVASATAELAKGMRLTKSTRDKRTVDGEDVPYGAYEPRSDNAMRPLAENVLNEMATAQFGGKDLLDLLRDGRHEASGQFMQPGVSSVICRTLIQTGRYVEFGFTKRQSMDVMRELAGDAGFTEYNWGQVLDPITRAKAEADAEVAEQMAEVVGEPAEAAADKMQSDLLKAQVDALADALAETKADLRDAIARAKEEKARADQEREVGRAEGMEQGKADALKTAAEMESHIRQADRTAATQVAPAAGSGSKLTEATAVWGRVLDRLQNAKEKRGGIFKGLNDLAAKLKKQMGARFSLAEGAANAANQDQINIGFITLVEEGVSFERWQAVTTERLQGADVDMEALFVESLKRYEQEIERLASETAPDVVVTKPRTKKKGEASNDTTEPTPFDAPELDRFENWLMGEQLEGLESVTKMAARYVQPSRWNREGFLAGMKNLFPTLDIHILEDAADRINETVENRLAAKRRQVISAFTDKLAGKPSNKPKAQQLAKFFGSLKRASDLGVLDADTFVQAFASAFNFNGLTAARVAQFQKSWENLQTGISNGSLFGMERETVEREFLEAVNAVAPAARWDDALFDQYQSAILASASSISNQFSPVTRIVIPLDALRRGFKRGNPQRAIADWFKANLDMIKGLPFVLTGVRGESLGHLPSELKGNFRPGSQKLALTDKGGFRIQVGKRVFTIPPMATMILRLKELWAWRAIRGAEGLVGLVDARNNYVDFLALFYKGQGMKSEQAYKKARADVLGTRAERAAAMSRAKSEQFAGRIGMGEHVLNRRVEEIIQRIIDKRLGEDLSARAEQLTAQMNFKTEPTGLGYFLSGMMGALTSRNRDTGRVEGFKRLTRFFFLFGRFLGHTLDSATSYTPGLHLLNLLPTTDRRNRLINEVFGSRANFVREQNAKAAAGGSLMLMAGMLQVLAQAMGGDDDEPFFQIDGFLPSANRAERDRLAASGKWQEGTIKIFGKAFNYTQWPELVAPLSILGNLSDYARFGDASGVGKKGESVGWGERGFAVVSDVLTAPVKRSTYKQWAELAAILAGASGGATDPQSSTARLAEVAANLGSSPIGGITRLPILVDLDRYYRSGESKDAEGLAENMARRIPFVHVGDRMINSYGEVLPGQPFLNLLPGKPPSSPDVQKAATLNVETNTVRNRPDDVGETDEEKEKFQLLAGNLYTKTMVKNEARIRDLMKSGDADGAKKMVEDISTLANDMAKEKLFPKIYSPEAKKEAARLSRERSKAKKRAAEESGKPYIVLPE